MDLLRRQDVPIVIPMREGTFTRPQDWWRGICLTDFIFLRGGGGAAPLGENVRSFVDSAKVEGARLCLITFSSMPVERATMLKNAVRMVEKCRFNVRVIYVGKKLGNVPA